MQVQSSLMGMYFHDLCTVISVITSGIVVPWSLLLSFEVVWTPDPSGPARKGLGNNPARKCLHVNTAKMVVLNQPATWLLARADSQSAC